MLKFIRSIIKGVMDMQDTTQQLSGVRPVSDATIEMIKEFESFREDAYKDIAGVWTIGYGNTYYQDGSPVKQGDTVTLSEGTILYHDILNEFAAEVNELVRVELNDCQFGALVSLSYNIGINAFKKSTLLRKVNADPDDPAIAKEFIRWIRSGGRTVNGLIRRRKKESEFYFSKNC